MHRTIFHEPWWLDVVSGGHWGTALSEKGGHVQGWLPYGTFKERGMTACGTPQLTRVLHPVLSVEGKKNESLNRRTLAIVSDLVAQLPSAHITHFVLGPDCPDALAWQMNGFRTRLLHTLVVDTRRPGFDAWSEMRDKTRNVIRRAEERLDAVPLPAIAFRTFYLENLDGVEPYFDSELIPRLSEAAESHGQGRILGAFDRHGELHAAVFFVWDERDYYYFLSTRTRRSAELGAVSLLIWHGIQDALARGLRFDFDGITSRERLQFMMGFGGAVAHRTVVEKGSLLFDARRHLGSFKQRVVQGQRVLMARLHEGRARRLNGDRNVPEAEAPAAPLP
ncbi:GNAT family N-acetyltransferase [Azospirillum rugosum]|uniref:BioF2-like acetyltransferase domain-containing protein n=1 Tax=Azospirillum rugosum TaxID=416170 RepID=A0ABS4SRY0_9PROT|nr:GNAT family N-acetyltransferase [Azospirillum rugosum]MBP2295320.1 hypothetical protein [Azospirillum rugosum]MDQ0528695.1 hypothetical protein [Azospirillum rugosum]